MDNMLEKWAKSKNFFVLLLLVIATTITFLVAVACIVGPIIAMFYYCGVGVSFIVLFVAVPILSVTYSIWEENQKG